MPLLDTLDDLSRLTAAVTPAHGALPTPCAGLDVAALHRHLLGWLRYFDAALRDPAGAERPDPHAYDGTPDGALEIKNLIATVREAADGPVRLDRLGGTYPLAATLQFLQVEALVHGWDLARATGLPWRPDAAAAEANLAFLKGMIQPEYRGDGLPFGPEVPAPDDAPVLDRLVAFTGRDPRWAPPAR